MRSLTSWPILALILALGLGFSRETYDPTLVKVTAAWLLVAAGLMLLAVAAVSGRLALPERRRLDTWVAGALFTGWLLARISPYPWWSYRALGSYALMALVYLSARLALGPSDRAAVRAAFGLATALAAVFGLAGMLAPGLVGYSLFAPGGFRVQTLASTMGNPDHFAGWLLLVFPLFVVDAADRERTGRAGRAALVCLSGLTLACLLLTMSRAGWLGLGAELWMLFRRSKDISSRTAASEGRQANAPRGPAPGADPAARSPQPAALGRRCWPIAVAAMLVAVLVLAWVPGVAAKLTGTSTLRQRFLIWQGAALAVAERPLTGHGPGAFGAAFPRFRPPDYRSVRLPHFNEYAHNLALHAAATGGLVGLLVLLAGLRALFGDGGAREPRHVAMAGILVQNLFSVTLCIVPLAVAASLVAALPGSAAGPRRALAAGPRWLRPCAGTFLAFLALLAGYQWREAGFDEEASRCLKQGREAMEARREVQGAAGAVALLRESNRLRPLEPAARYRLGGLRALEGDLPAALASYVMVESLSPFFAEVTANRAEVYRVMGHEGAALHHAKLWKDMNRADPASHVLMARVLEGLGRRDEARENAVQARALGGSGPELSELLQRLSRPR